MKEQDIRLLISQIWQGIERQDNTPPKGFASVEEQTAYRTETAAIIHRSHEAAFDLVASSLCALHRIADAQERIAKALEYDPKPLLISNDERDDVAAQRG
jgi:hypothetical protein